MLFRCILSDFYKLKHSPVLWLHIFIPLLGAFLFLWYYTITGSKDPIIKISYYLEALCVTFPILIGLLCGMTAAQEEEAGNYQEILSGIKSRTAAYLSKLILLLVLSAFSVALAVGIFSIGFQSASALFYFKAALAVFGGNIFLYLLHLFISFRFGRGASIGLGVVGTLLSALMLTGLGNGIWHWVPWAWSVRFCDDIAFSLQYPSKSAIAIADMHYGIRVSVLAVCISAIASLLWFHHWEGSQSNE